MTGSHNHVVNCETHYIAGADILQVDGNRHNIHGNDFSYGAGGSSVNLVATSSYLFLQGNRLFGAVNSGSNNEIRNNIVDNVFKASGF